MVSVLDIFVPPKCHFIVTPSCVVQSNVPSSQAGGSLWGGNTGTVGAVSKPATSLSVSPKLSLDDVIGNFLETQSTVWQAVKVPWISRA